jgi:hypothetical protein
MDTGAGNDRDGRPEDRTAMGRTPSELLTLVRHRATPHALRLHARYYDQRLTP